MTNNPYTEEYVQLLEARLEQRERAINGLRNSRVEILRDTAFKLTPHEQFRLAWFIAENVGYVLAKEPEHPDSPHAREDEMARLGNAKAILDDHPEPSS